MDQDKEEEQMDEEDKATNKNTQNQKGRRRRRRVRTPGNTKNMAGMVVSEPTDIVERSREILGLRSRRVGKRLAILMVFKGVPKRKKEKPREVTYCGIAQPSPEPWGAYRPSGGLLSSFHVGGLWPGNNRRGPGAGSPPRMSREAPKGKRKSQGRSRCFDVGGLWSGGAGAPRDEPRGPKRKKEKPREVKIL